MKNEWGWERDRILKQKKKKKEERGSIDLDSEFSSVQDSHSVVSDSLQPHEPQHARPPCPSPTPRVYSNSCQLSCWCHSIISSSVLPFSTHLQSSPASGSFQMSQFFYVRWPKYWSFSFNISPTNEHTGLIFLRMDWLDLLAVQGALKSLLQHYSSKASILQCLAFFIVQFSSPNVTIGKTIALTRPLLAKQSLCFLICCLGWS